MAQNPNVTQTSLPQTIPPPSAPMVRMGPDGQMIVNQNWYLFLYNVARQVLPVNGPPLISFGGPVTVVDGGDVAQGSVNDAVWVGGAGTEVSLLKAMVAQYTTEYDYDVSGNAIYYGIAATGTPTASSLWQVRQMVYSGTGNMLSMLYANGSRAFNSVWNNRVSLVYS